MKDDDFERELAALDAARLGEHSFTMQPDQEPPAPPSTQSAKRVPKFPADATEHMALIFGKP